MIFYRHVIQLVFFILLLSLGILGLDYYILIYPIDTQALRSKELLFVLEKLISPARMVVILSYFLLLIIRSRIPAYRTAEQKPIEIPFWLQVSGFLVAISGAYVFMNIERLTLSFKVVYPISLLLFVVGLALSDFLFTKRKHRLINFRKQKKSGKEYALHLRTKGRGWVNVNEPFRHTIVIAGSGSGKTESIVRPYLRQFIQKDFCGILYDYKFPTLTNELNNLMIQKGATAPMPLYILDFENINRCHRLNPIRPDNIKDISYAEEIATSIYSNLDLSTLKQHENFFSRSAINWFTALIWFYKVKHPEQCTLPHVFNTILYQDYQHVFSMLLSEPSCGDYIRSILTSLDTKADRQLGGQIASLQNVIARLNTPKLAWILSGDDFDLNINDPLNPKLLSVGMNPQIRKTLAPIISCIFTVAMQQMNVENKHKSFLMLDEVSTLFLDDLDHIGAVARSNKIAMVLIAQDTAMLVEKYGQQKAQTIIANMNNMFFGRTNLSQTAKIISETIGKEEREIISKQEGMSYNRQESASLSHGFNVQERMIIKPEEVQTLKQGEFVGRTTDQEQNYFWARFKHEQFSPLYTIEPFVNFVHQSTGEVIDKHEKVYQQHLTNIKTEVSSIISSYKNVYAHDSTTLTPQ